MMTSLLFTGCDTVITEPNPDPVIDPIVDPNPETTINTDPLNDENYERLFSSSTRKVLTISVTQQAYDELDGYMTAYMEQFGTYRSDDYVVSHITYEDDLGTLEMNQVGFRTRGNLSRNRIIDDEGNIIVNHYKLKFDETFGGTLDVSKRFMFGLEELDLKYNRNWDETYMNEHFALELYRSYEVFAQRTTLILVQLKIDDVIHKMGIYTAFEPIDETFIQRRFEGNHATGDLYKALWQQFGPARLVRPDDFNAIGIKDVETNYRPAYDLKTNKKTSTHEALLTFLDAMGNTEMYRQSFLETYVDLNYMARFFAVSHVLGNPDDIRGNGNNYFFYFDPEEELFYIIPYDLDHSLGQGWGGEPVYENQLVDTPIYNYPEYFDHALGMDVSIPFIDTLMSMPTFQVLYEDTLKRIVEEPVFTFDYVKAEIDTFEEAYANDIQSLYISLAFGYRDLESYINDKKESILNQL